MAALRAMGLNTTGEAAKGQANSAPTVGADDADRSAPKPRAKAKPKGKGKKKAVHTAAEKKKLALTLVT